MIASAEMGDSGGNTEYLKDAIIEQVVYAVIGIILYFVCMKISAMKIRIEVYNVGYIAVLLMLLACRGFAPVNGAYAWFRFGGHTIQPSEFAKVFMILFGAKLFSVSDPEKNLRNFKIFAIATFILFIVIAFVQHDFGSGVVLFVICYCILMIPPYKEIRKYQNYMTLFVLIAIGFVLLLMSDFVTELMKKHADNYMIGRFLAAADPFLYRYDNGYHVIMALVSFANGGIFGLGYGKSIHKYMNFPNPSNDFILPVIVEELGIIGFACFLIAYAFLLVPLIRISFKTKSVATKMVLFGVFAYFIVHFILNVGGVSAIIPLTGVPLLLISSGGSSLLASMMGLGFAQNEIIRNKEIENESNSREI